MSARMSLRRWMARLAFSFFIVAFALFWRGQKRWQSGAQDWQAALLMAGGVACVIAGAIGVRMRHERVE